MIKAYPKNYDNLIDCSSKAGECPAACVVNKNAEAPDFIPTCVYERDPSGQYAPNYALQSEGDSVSEFSLNSESRKYYYEPIRKACVRTERLSNDVIRIKYYDCENERYEVPVDINTDLSSFPEENGPDLVVQLRNDAGVKIQRGDHVFFDSTEMPIILEDQFLQISSKLEGKFI